MSRHELADDADEFDHDDRGVSFATSLRWNMAIGRRHVLPSAHASCDCRSYHDHQRRNTPTPGWNLDPCPGPLATLHVERQRWDEFVAHTLGRQSPWLTPEQVAAIIAWQPGHSLPY